MCVIYIYMCERCCVDGAKFAIVIRFVRPRAISAARHYKRPLVAWQIRANVAAARI